MINKKEKMMTAKINSQYAMAGETFTFGAQYLRGLTPDRADWDRDMSVMRSLGFNTIRAWLVWGVLEPEEGKIDLESLSYFLDCAGKHGLRVIFLFHLHGTPEWAIRKHPEYWYTDERGNAFEPSARSNTPSGGWPGLCPDNPEVMDIEESFIGRIVSAFGGRHEVFAWEPINEPHMWQDTSRSPSGIYCYCPATREAFRGWLKNKYGSLEALGRAWGRRLDVWESVRPPTWKFGFSDWADWRTFTAENVAALVKRRGDAIRRHGGKSVIAHAWGGGSVGCPALGDMAFDDWKNAASTDIWGCSSFPSKVSQLADVGLAMDSTRGAAAGREFWQSELGTGDYSGGLARGGNIDPRIFALHCWEALAHGTDGLLFWQFRKEAHGSEIGCYGLTDYGGELTKTGAEAGRIGAALAGNAALLHAAKAPDAEVAILFSYQSHMVTWAQYRKGEIYVNSINGYYRAFWNANIPVDILHEEFLDSARLSKYKLIILPFPVALAGGAGAALSEYVRKGGSIISDPCLCLFDPGKALSKAVPGQGLDTVFGAAEHDVRSVNGETVEFELRGRRYSLSGSHFLAIWKPRAGTSSLALTGEGLPLVVDSTAHGGHAILSGVNLGMCGALKQTAGSDFSLAADTPKNSGDAAALILALAETAGVKPSLSAPKGIRVVCQPAGQGRAVLTVLNTSAGPVKGRVRFPAGSAWRRARELFPDKEIITFDAELPLDMSPWQSSVFELSEK
jgi:beta-galactosidase GanA